MPSHKLSRACCSASQSASSTAGMSRPSESDASASATCARSGLGLGLRSGTGSGTGSGSSFGSGFRLAFGREPVLGSELGPGSGPGCQRHPIELAAKAAEQGGRPDGRGWLALRQQDAQRGEPQPEALLVGALYQEARALCLVRDRLRVRARARLRLMLRVSLPSLSPEPNPTLTSWRLGAAAGAHHGRSQAAERPPARPRPPRA